MTKEQIERCGKRDAAIDTLTRLKGMFGAMIYLMDGEHHILRNEYAEFANWIEDVKDRLEGVIAEIGEI